MAVSFKSLSSPEGLKELDTYLLSRSYISGYQASRDDLAVYSAIAGAPADLPNVARWYKHITFLLGHHFPGQGVGVSIAGGAGAPASAPREAPAAEPSTPAPTPAPAAAPSADDDDDDDLDLFGEQTEEEKKAAEEREAAAAKKPAKKAVIGKSSVLLDIKPWDDETDMVKLEAAVRNIQQEGLTWGASKLVPVGYGIKKLTMMMTIVDDLVSVDDLIEDKLCAEGSECAEHIQSCDVAAFNKI